ncbi:MAG TPA: methionyl-tRNA formyltransferase [Candidatus Eremiobacteraceae bacterium]|nr:methionyl-tRNA formyltransferase [Candidatus Eremiobacteraceae bacterium]
MAARRLRTVFFGSSEFAVPSLERMLEQHEVVAIYSQPDSPAGRGLRITPTPVSIAGGRAGREVLKPRRLDGPFIESIARLRPELLASASYGKILPSALLELPGLTALNVHPSLLPRYRGASPIQSALRDGCEETGVTVFWMTARMDAGDIAVARSVAIDAADDYATLHNRLAGVGAELLGEAARLLSEGQLTRLPQREEDATYCRTLTKEDLQLQFAVPARIVVNQIRSVSPKPGAWMLLDGKRLKVLKAEVASIHGSVAVDFVSTVNPASTIEPGKLIANEPAGPLIATEPGAIRLLEVVPEGRRLMTGAEFAQHTASRH